MDKLRMISGLRRWLEENQPRLMREGIRLEILGQTPYVPSSIHVDMKADRYEAQVELWEDGQSEFYFLDWEAANRDPNVGVVVTHYDFQDPAELYAALDDLIKRISKEAERFIVIADWPSSGYSETIQINPESSKPFSLPTAKGKSR